MTKINNPKHILLIMAGGAGSRLWPISREKRPKQFQIFIGEETLLQHMFNIAKQAVPTTQIFIMATADFAEIIHEQIPDLPKANILFEPARRDNGPAIVLGILKIAQKEPNAIVTTLWSDHYIQKPEVLVQTLNTAYETALDHPDQMITVGAKPTSADTGLGYIEMGETIDHKNNQWVFKVARFIEKPEKKEAQQFLQKWQYFWNIGYKTMSIPFFLAQFTKIQPELKTTVKKIEKNLETLKQQDDDSHLERRELKGDKTVQGDKELAELYEQLPKLSIEYLFTQYLTEMLVIPVDIGWSDIGNWDTLHEILKQSPENDQIENGIIKKGQVIDHNSKNSLIIAKTKQITVIGIKNLIIIEDDDAILVLHKDSAHNIKDVVPALREQFEHLL